MEVLDREELLVQAQELEPLPATVQRLAALVADPNSELAAIVEAISLDSALTVKLLRVANSAASRSTVEITTVDQAVMRVGTGSVLSMAVAAGVRGRMEAPLDAYALEEGQLWCHSVSAALAAESLRGLVADEVPPESFTAALLHDVGKLVLARFLSSQIEALLQRCSSASEGVGLDEERALLDVDHAELGAIVAQHWKLPESIVTGIRHHHEPPAAPADDPSSLVAWIVQLANLTAHRLAASAGEAPNPADAAFEPALDRLGLDATSLEKLLFRTQLRIDQVGARFGGADRD